ncbi:acyltransferase family protein [Nitratireductor luteus]|uniref:acyltransferase family protein n=1 Tax=Nitratireductor luteus TaxID=2976980 RepID=UPI00223E92E6|nr:acyltransferase family protein [Nitratireductor luteus]
MAGQERLYYVDALRVGAFLLLIAYHASVAFFPGMDWLIDAPQTSYLLEQAMMFPRAWRLALLFFVSGMGTWFLFRRESGPYFLKQRFIRLFPPLIFAMCVVIVPQVWYERMYEAGYEGSFLTFWVTRYFTEGKYPEGNFTWAHMWFVAYLLVMCLICYPVFHLVQSRMARPVMAWFERVAGTGWIYLFFLLPLVLNVIFTPFFPRQTNALYNDGAWFAVWASWFGLGFLMARHHKALITGIVEKRLLSAAIAFDLALFLYVFSWNSSPIIGDENNRTLLYKTALFALAWSMILTLVGFAAHHLNRKSAAVGWLNQKVFPLYMVHQTVIVAALYYVLPWGAGAWVSFAAVFAATAGFSLLFAMVAELAPGRLALLVGLNPPAARPKAASTRQALPARR